MVSKKDLSEAVRTAHEKGELTDELAAMALKIGRGFIRQDRYSDIPFAQREDALSKWLIGFATKWRRLDPDQNCFAYISHGVSLAIMSHMRGESRRFKYESEKANSEYERTMEEVRRYVAVREAEISLMDHRHKYHDGK